LKAIIDSLLLEDFASVERLEAAHLREVVGLLWIEKFRCHNVGIVRLNSAGRVVLRARFGFGQPPPPKLFRRNAGHIGLNVENWGSIEHV